MPTLLGMYDAYLDSNKDQDEQKFIKTTQVKKSINSFTNLSPNVQKMLNNISDTECSENHKCNKGVRTSSVQKVSRYLEGQKAMYSSARLHRQSKSYDNKFSVSSGLNKSSEFLNTICDNVTMNVQKMLSNIPDQDLVISTDHICDNNNKINNNNNNNNNQSFLYKNYCNYNKNSESNQSVRRTISFNVTTSTQDEFINKTHQPISPNLSTNHKFKSSTIPGNYLQVS